MRGSKLFVIMKTEVFTQRTNEKEKLKYVLCFYFNSIFMKRDFHLGKIFTKSVPQVEKGKVVH